MMEAVEGTDMELSILLAAFGPMRREDYGNDDVLKAVYRYAMNNRRADINQIANRHFEEMQHKLQIKKKKPRINGVFYCRQPDLNRYGVAPEGF